MGGNDSTNILLSARCLLRVASSLLALSMILWIGGSSLRANPVGVAYNGPFVGAVQEGGTNQHRYTWDPIGNRNCAPYITTYTVTLVHEDSTENLEVAANGESSSSQEGHAEVSFKASNCASFEIEVTGLRVDVLAAYRVDVERE